MKKITAIFLIIIYLLTFESSFFNLIFADEEEKPVLAIADLMIGKGVPKALEGSASLIPNYLEKEVIKTALFNVVDRKTLQTTLVEHGIKVTCGDVECIKDIGEILSADKVMTGEIEKIENTYYITVRLVDVLTLQVEKSETMECWTPEQFSLAAKSITELMFVPQLEGEILALKSKNEIILNIGEKDGVKKDTYYTILQKETTLKELEVSYKTIAIGEVKITKVEYASSFAQITKLDPGRKIKPNDNVRYKPTLPKIVKKKKKNTFIYILGVLVLGAAVGLGGGGGGNGGTQPTSDGTQTNTEPVTINVSW